MAKSRLAEFTPDFTPFDRGVIRGYARIHLEFCGKIGENWTPEGFELKDESTVGEFSQKKYYENNEDYIEFVQEVLPTTMVMGIDNEHGINDIITDGDGIKYVIHFDEEEDYYLIMWSNDIYLFTLRTNTSQETAFDLCKSTKIK